MPITTIIALEEVRKTCSQWRLSRQSIAFVPTMGALHEGHLALVREAKKRADRVVVSIFVNPLQFGPKEDFASYPRMLQDDRVKLERENVDLLFVPNASEMYPEGFQTYIYNSEMADTLCGHYRPGHFQGVLTVVAKLFHLVQPQLAFFGKKDYQQFKLISKMVTDLFFDVQVEGLPTLREKDGLAMSSRNLRLQAEERQKAPHIFRCMQVVNAAYKKGERRRMALLSIFEAEFNKVPGFRLEYVEVRYQDELTQSPDELEKPAVILVAAYLGSVRLIDNLELGDL